MVDVYLNDIGTAVPARECQREFLETLPLWIHDDAVVQRLRTIAARSGIQRRHTALDDVIGPPGSGAFYEAGRFPGTAARMEVYRREAPRLVLQATGKLQAAGTRVDNVTHLVITSCTGFYAPGLDVDLIRLLGLSPDVRRTMIGFMGCYAAITGLRTASDIVRADPVARVLMVNLELCTLHLQQDAPFDRLVSALLFADGCAASVISADPAGFRLDRFTSCLSLEDADRMAWLVGDQGFAMTLDASVPARIREILRRRPDVFAGAASSPRSCWAIHPGGRAIIEAVQSALGLSAEQVGAARRVLAQYGNMSSASVMFVFDELRREGASDGMTPGGAIAFGPGLTLEALEFTRLPCGRDVTRENGPAVGDASCPDRASADSRRASERALVCA